jgi:internalin A
MSNRPGYLDHLSPLQRLWFIFGTMVSLLSAIPAPGKQSPNTTKIQSFTQWCQQKESVPAATKKTIQVLLGIANTTDCQIANTDLSSRNELEISGHELPPKVVNRNFEKPESYYQDIENIKGITDLRPLAGFTKLTKLTIEGTQVSDLKPLALMLNLRELDLNNNQISDIKPLSRVNASI